MMLSEDKNDLLTLEDLCNRLIISETVAYRLLRSGEIRGFKIGPLWRIPTSSVNEYISSQCAKQSNTNI